MTIFNNPNFSGNPATTTLTVEDNQTNGINVLTGSEVLDDNYAVIVAQQNAMAGIAVDNGSSVTFGQTIPVSGGVQSYINLNNPDFRVTFGSRLTTISNDNFVTFSCDATALVRGPGNITCPR